MRNRIIGLSLFLFIALFMFAGNVLAANMDLTIEDVSFSPAQPVVGQTTKIIITVRYNGDVNLMNNYGINNVAFSHHDFQAENNLATGASVSPSAASPLVSGSTFTYNIFGKFTASGEKTLVFKIDGDNQLPESNEDNNTFNKTIQVLQDGDLIKLLDSSAIYIIKADGSKHLFSNEATFWSYYTGTWSNLKLNGSNVFTQNLTQTNFDSIKIGNNVTVKSGSRLIRFTNSPRVYLVYGGNKLKYMDDPVVLKKYFGASWGKTLVTIQDSFENDYDKSGNLPFIDDDGDGVSNNDEITLYDTNPNNPDTDGDGYKDGEEIINGYNPNGSGKL